MQNTNVTEYLDGPVREFSIYNCDRSIPSGLDGLKPSQRKVLFGMLKKFGNSEVKVSIASSGIMEVSAYHHGSLDGVIVNMAQSFPGSNNVPLLEGIGQFGSRISPDSAAPRYIFTKLTKAARELFHADDTDILEYLEDDGDSIEPKYYLPILPLLLLNGADGMGTGYACSVMAYNPDDLKKRIIDLLDKKKIKNKLIPWYRGFTGTIEKDGDQVIVSGNIEKIDSVTLKITELPIGLYTIKYREVLNALEDKNTIKSYVDNSTEDKTEFIIKTTREIASLSEDELKKLFKLVSRNTENITVWTDEDKIKKFNSADQLIEWFVTVRLEKYEQRRLCLIKKMTDQLDWLKEQINFIKLYLKNSKRWSGCSDDEVVAELKAEGLTRIDDLLSIRVRRLTGDAIKKLNDEFNIVATEISRLNSTTPADMYREDLAHIKL